MNGRSERVKAIFTEAALSPDRALPRVLILVKRTCLGPGRDSFLSGQESHEKALAAATEDNPTMRATLERRLAELEAALAED